MHDKINNCPRCGEIAEWYESSNSVMCLKCPLTVEDWELDAVELIKIWNSMPNFKKSEELKERLRMIKVLCHDHLPKAINEYHRGYKEAMEHVFECFNVPIEDLIKE